MVMTTVVDSIFLEKLFNAIEHELYERYVIHPVYYYDPATNAYYPKPIYYKQKIRKPIKNEMTTGPPPPDSNGKDRYKDICFLITTGAYANPMLATPVEPFCPY